jgi:UPF0716 protein FxsA
MLRLFLLLLPAAEVMLAISLGRHVGGIWVLAGFVAGAVLGSLLIRFRGQRFFREAMAAINRQEMPGEALVGGIAWYLAGLLFIIPGFISDGLALIVLLPPVRRRVLVRFRKLAEEHLVKAHGASGFQWTAQGGWQPGPGAGGVGGNADGNGRGRVFEGEGREIDEAAPRLPPRPDQPPP